MADTVTRIWGIGGKTNTVSLLRTIAAAGDYAAEDVLSDSASAGTAMGFTGIGKNKGAGGKITQGIVLCSVTALTPRLTLFLFRNTPTCNLNDNVANTAVLAADQSECVGWIDFPALEDLGTGMSSAVATPNTFGNLPLSFNCDADDDTLYGVLVTRDAITGEVASMTIRITLTSEEN